MKNKDILLDVIGDIDEALIPELSHAKNKRSHIVKWTAIGGICAAAVIAGIILLPGSILPNDTLPDSIVSNSNLPDSTMPGSLSSGTVEKVSARLLASAVYPEIPVYPDKTAYPDWEDFEPVYDAWWEARHTLRDQPEGYKDGFDTFFLNSTRTFLADAGTDNKVYSPLSLFMALGMSAEISDGNTRQQILDVLAQNDIDTLRSHSKSIWQANYMDDGMAKCVLANSLWTNSSIPYTQDTIDFLAENYYSSVYSGDPGSEEYNRLMQDWLNEQTDGLLEDYVSDISMNPETVLALASTVNYSGKWEHKFSVGSTETGMFHSPSGDVSCDFMNAEKYTTYFWGEKFAAISMGLENNGQMRLILPDEGITPEELINDDNAIGYMINTDEYSSDKYVNHKFVSAYLSLPKFDISTNIAMKEGLEKLGITDAFEPSDADFSPLTGQADGIFINKIEQDTRVMIDEEGCKASSLTVMMAAGAAEPEDNADFILDRPFIFEIMSENGLPLFVGIVNDPVQ